MHSVIRNQIAVTEMLQISVVFHVVVVVVVIVVLVFSSYLIVKSLISWRIFGSEIEESKWTESVIDRHYDDVV